MAASRSSLARLPELRLGRPAAVDESAGRARAVSVPPASVPAVRACRRASELGSPPFKPAVRDRRSQKRRLPCLPEVGEAGEESAVADEGPQLGADALLIPARASAGARRGETEYRRPAGGASVAANRGQERALPRLLELPLGGPLRPVAEEANELVMYALVRPGSSANSRTHRSPFL